jgi:hypothetical protein
MLPCTGLKANETGARLWRSMDTRVFPPPIKISPCRNTRSAPRGARSSVPKKGRVSDVHFGLAALHDLVGMTAGVKNRSEYHVALLLREHQHGM